MLGSPLATDWSFWKWEEKLNVPVAWPAWLLLCSRITESQLHQSLLPDLASNGASLLRMVEDILEPMMKGLNGTATLY